MPKRVTNESEQSSEFEFNKDLEPTQDASFNIGTPAKRVKRIHAQEIQSDTMIQTSSSLDSSGVLCGIHYAPEGALASQIVQNVNSFEQSVGSKFDVISIYQTLSVANYSHVQNILNAGYSAQFFLQVNQTGNTSANLDQIINDLATQSGSYYTQLVALFQTMVADGRENRVFLSVFHEGNSNYLPWGVFLAGNTTAKYISAYRSVVTLARSLGVRSKFLQIYNVKNSGSSTNAYTTSFNDLFAGDAYVDYVGIDDYNRYNVSYSYWAFPGANLLGAYRQVTEMSSKPVIIGEFNSAPSSGGNSRSEWLTTYARLLMSPMFNRVVMATLFVQDKSSEGSGNWFINTSEEYSAVNSMVKTFRARPTEIRLPIKKNLLPASVTNSLTGWTRIGTGALDVSTDVPDSFDPTEFSIKYTKPSSTLGTPESYNFFYLPTDSFWTPGKPYYLSFYAKSTVKTKISVGVRRNTSPFEYAADFFVEIGTEWKPYYVPIITDLAGDVRLPFFAFGRVTDALDFYVAGIKLERGQYPSPRTQEFLGNKVLTGNLAVTGEIAANALSVASNGTFTGSVTANNVTASSVTTPVIVSQTGELQLPPKVNLQSDYSCEIWLESDAINSPSGESDVSKILLTGDGNRVLGIIQHSGGATNDLEWRTYSTSGVGSGINLCTGGIINNTPKGTKPVITTASVPRLRVLEGGTVVIPGQLQCTSNTDQIKLKNATINAPSNNPRTLQIADSYQNATILTNSIVSGLTNTSSRPALSAGNTPEAHTIRGISSTSLASDDGFLRLRAGGGTNTSSVTAIDLSGSSTVSDMNRNIVLSVAGTEKVRVANLNTTFTTPLFLPNASGSGTPSELSHYEEYSAAFAFAGPWSTPQNCTLKFVRIGKIVTVQMSSVAADASNAIIGASTTTTIPVQFRPPTSVMTPVVILDNNTFKTGHVIVTFTGSVIVYNTYDVPWSGANSTGWETNSFSYIL